MEDPGKVGAGGEEDEEDRQDQGELDDRLAARSRSDATE